MALISPSSFDPLLRFISVRLQQGVPLVDADVNELDDIRKFELRTFLKWFVGNGVPEGTDGFRIAATGSADDFDILAGAQAAPAGADNVFTGLGHVGRCLVDGRDVIIANDATFRGQALHVSQPGAAALAADWGVSTIPELPNLTGTVVLYLDVWDRLVTPTEDPSLIFAGIGTESAARLRREWAVRWKTAAATPAFGDPDYAAGHSYYALAALARRAGDPVVVADDVTDLRERRLLVPPATLIEDILGTTALRYRQGLDRPAVSVREAVNALLHGELPASVDAPIAPAPADDDMSFAFDFVSTDVVGFWHSDRVGATEQVFGIRWPQDDPAAAATTPPQQITSGIQHRLPHAVQLPGGDFLVVYETNARDIHYRRAPHLAGLAGAPEQPVATDPATFERHPYLVRTTNQLVFMWHRTTPGPRWVYRRRQYGAGWNEAGASWLDGGGVELSPINASPALPVTGDVHVVVADGLVNFAFRTSAHDIAVCRLNPATAAIDDWGGLTFGTAAQDSQPYLVVDGTDTMWVFWRSGDQGIWHARYDVASNAWGAAGLVAGTDATGNADSRPTAVRAEDGAIWLFWVSLRGGNNDIWAVRRNPATDGWGEPRQVVAAGGNDDLPFARLGDDGVIWLFWRSDRAGNFDLYTKRLITAI